MKKIAKSLLYVVAGLLVAPWALLELMARALAGRDVFFAGQAEFFALMPGKFGSMMRNMYYHWTLERCPLHCAFLAGSRFTHSQAKVGERVYVGSNCILGMVDIGDDTMLADNIQVLSGKSQHGFADPAVPFQQQAGSFSTVVIGANAWIGTSAVVMASIGKDCIIGAGSVVTRDIPEGQVAAGNPTKVLRPTFGDREAALREAQSGQS